MANLTTSTDIINSALRRAGEVTDGSSEFEATATELLNEIHLDALAASNKFDFNYGDTYPWAKEKNPGVLTLEPKLITGTVSVANGSTSASFSSAPAATKADWVLKVTGDDTFYRVDTHTAAATAFTLDANYLGTTDTEAGYELFKVWYDLESSILRLVSPMLVYVGQAFESNGSGEVAELDFTAFKREWSFRRILTGVPTRFTRIADNTNTQVITVRFNKVPNNQIRLEYDRIKFPTDLTDSASDIPKLPREYRQALVYGIAYLILLEKNDNRAQNFFQLAQASFKASSIGRKKELGQTSRNFGRVFGRPDMGNSRRRIFIAEVDGES